MQDSQKKFAIFFKKGLTNERIRCIMLSNQKSGNAGERRSAMKTMMMGNMCMCMMMGNCGNPESIRYCMVLPDCILVLQ